MATFNEAQFEKKLHTLKDSQDSIQTLSNWCLQHRTFHKKIVSTWLRVLKKVKTEHRLTLFYLANDVIQYSKRKNYEFVESWGTALQRATTMVREEKVKHRVLRIFKIWDERGIYDEAFISDLCGLLSTTTKKNVPENNADPVDFQPSSLINKIRSCRKMEDDTDVKFKRVKDSHLSLSDADALRSHLKDRRQGDDVVAEVDEGVSKLQGYVNALECEIKERTELVELLEQGQAFYDNQKGEAKVVANAYRNFGTRVKNLKRRLDEMMPNLKDVSPIPSPPNIEDVPSPSPDSDVDIPGLNPPNPDYMNAYVPPPSQPIRTVMEDSQDKPSEGFASFMGNALPFDVQKNLFSESSGGIVSPSPEPVQEDPGGSSGVDDVAAAEGKPIEVISSRTKPEESFSITDFLKSLIPPRTETIPGLTLDTPDHPASPGLAKPSYNEPEIMNQPAPAYEYPPATTTSTPLQPPPLPPSLFSLDDSSQYKYGQPSETEDSWNTKLPPKFPTWGDTTNAGWEPSEGSDKVSEWMPAMPVNKVTPVEIVDTPESPPMYEKEGFSDPVEYDDSVIEPSLIAASTDVDHRTLVPLPLANHSIEEAVIQSEDHLEDTDHRLLMHMTPANHVKKDIDHRSVVHRKKDVDHRNLISLTGSPMREPHAPLAPPPTPPNLPWPRGDQDYRSQLPRKLKEGNPAIGEEMMSDDDVDYRLKGPKPKSSDELQDNVESVDMEMSDEEGVDSSGIEGISVMKTEMSPIKNIVTDMNSGKSTISFNISSPAKLLASSPLNEIKEDPSRSRNRVYGCQRIPTIGGGTHSPRMMRFPPPAPLRPPFPSPRNLRPNLLAPPPPPPPLAPQFNSVRIRPITELIHLSQNVNEIPPPEVVEENAMSVEPPIPISKEVQPEAETSEPWKPVSNAEPVSEGPSENINTRPLTATPPPPPPPWNSNQDSTPKSPLESGSDKEPQNVSDVSDQPNADKKWTPEKSDSQEPWLNDNIPEFEVHEVERLNSFDRGRGRGRGGSFMKNFSPMPSSPQGGPRGGFNHRGRPGWGPRRGGPQVPPPPPPPPPPRFPFRPPMDSFRGHRGGFRPPFRGNNPRHFGW
ncbi:hypothetical protein R5R35_014647 [Gryllus longicercus]|uniref:Regulation of nuclear pre-mRNA domain-containing protein 2 n=1 Tax=Gryllus longicercus TaxID=2509291 RepID=A0AAN9VML9_9ORTH